MYRQSCHVIWPSHNQCHARWPSRNKQQHGDSSSCGSVGDESNAPTAQITNIAIKDKVGENDFSSEDYKNFSSSKHDEKDSSSKENEYHSSPDHDKRQNEHQDADDSSSSGYEQRGKEGISDHSSPHDALNSSSSAPLPGQIQTSQSNSEHSSSEKRSARVQSPTKTWN